MTVPEVLICKCIPKCSRLIVIRIKGMQYIDTRDWRVSYVYYIHCTRACAVDRVHLGPGRRKYNIYIYRWGVLRCCYEQFPQVPIILIQDIYSILYIIYMYFGKGFNNFRRISLLRRALHLASRRIQSLTSILYHVQSEQDIVLQNIMVMTKTRV